LGDIGRFAADGLEIAYILYMLFCRKHKKRPTGRRKSVYRGPFSFLGTAILVVVFCWQIGLAGLVADSGLFFDNDEDIVWDGGSPLTWAAITASEQFLGESLVWFLPGLTVVSPVGSRAPLADDVAWVLDVADVDGNLLGDGIIAFVFDESSGTGSGYFLRQLGYEGVYSFELAGSGFAEMADDDLADMVSGEDDFSPLVSGEEGMGDAGPLLDDGLLAADLVAGEEDVPVSDDLPVDGIVLALVDDLDAPVLAAYDDDWSYPAFSSGGSGGGGAGGGSGGAGGGGDGDDGPTPTPEPGAIVLFGTGLAWLVRRCRQ